MRIVLIALTLLCLGSVAHAQDEAPVVRFSVLPAVRGHAGDTHIRASTSVLTSVTYTGQTSIENCRISEHTLNYSNSNNSYRSTALVWIDHTETDAAGNTLAPVNTAFDMAPGQTRHFILRAESVYCGVWDCMIRLRLDCAGPDGTRTGNSADRYYSRGLPVESFLFNIGPMPMSDIIPVMVTASGDGYLRFSQTGGVAAASVAAVNIGVDREVTVVATASGGMAADICETDAAGQCLSPRDRSVTLQMNRDDIHLFSVRVRDIAGYSLPVSPAQHRLNVRFVERNVPELTVAIRLSGDTSVALDEPAATSAPATIAGVWQFSRCVNDFLQVEEYDPGDDTSGQRMIIGSNGFAVFVSQVGRIDFCNHDRVRLIRFDSIDFPLDAGFSGELLMSGSSTASEMDWTVGMFAEGTFMGVQSDATGNALTFSDLPRTNSSPPGLGDGEREIVARRDFNTVLVPEPSGSFRLEYELNGSEVAMTINIAEDLTFTTTDTLNCIFNGQLVRDPAAAARSIYQVTMTVTGCAAPIANYLGRFEGLVLFESTESGFALSGAAYGEGPIPTIRERFMFPLWAIAVAD